MDARQQQNNKNLIFFVADIFKIQKETYSFKKAERRLISGFVLIFLVH